MIQGKIKTEKEYRSLERDSSSTLKDFANNRKLYYKKYILGEKVEEEEDSKATIMGKLVETLLFEKDTFDNKFYMSSIINAPTGLMLDFVEALYRKTKEASDEEGNLTVPFEEIAKEAHKESGFKWSFEKVIEKFQGSDAEIYYKEIRQVRSKGLTVVTAQDVNNAERIVESLKSNEFTSIILNNNDSDIETFVQLKIEKFLVNNLEMKAMLDLVQIDHKLKEINIYDLKCVWAVENFLEEYYLYRKAYIQAYVYYVAVRNHFKHLIEKGYLVNYPYFIVCDSINYYDPLIYKLNSDHMDEAYFGFSYKNRDYKGVRDIINDLLWAKDTGKWTISRTNYINQGIVNIKF